VQLSFGLTYVLAQKLVPRAEGYGRCVAMEVLRNNTAIANIIRVGNWAQLYGAMETRIKEGMCTLEQALLGMYEQGLISKADAISHANDGAIVERIERAHSTGRR
jgi:Tfp pilus assembly ATPase PilU